MIRKVENADSLLLGSFETIVRKANTRPPDSCEAVPPAGCSCCKKDRSRQNRLFYGFEAQTVLNPQTPFRHESLLSWIARTAIENELPNITAIMRDVGQRHRNKLADVIWGDIDIAGLATILGSDLDAVQMRRGARIQDGMIRYRGFAVRASDLHTRSRRFSPKTLALDTTPFYRSSWLLKTFPVCMESWQVLRSRCECGTEQTWARVSTLMLCEGCGSDLRELDAPILAPEFQPGMKRLGDLMFGDDGSRREAIAGLPSELRNLDPGEMLELTILMARIVDPSMSNPREKVWRDEPQRFARALSRASDLLPRWPETPFLAVASACDINRAKNRDPVLRSLGAVLRRERGHVPDQVGTLIADVLRRIDLDSADPPVNLVEIGEASSMLRMRQTDIRAARVKGHLTHLFAMSRAEIVPAYDRVEIETIATTRGWRGHFETGEKLGLPPYGVEQLCAMDDLIWAKAPHRSLSLGLSIDPASVDALVRSLAASAADLDDLHDPVRLSVVMRGAGGREKAWGPVLRALTEGKWPYAVGRGGRILRSMHVERPDAEAIRSTLFHSTDWPLFSFMDELSQADACDILNVSIRDRADLSRYKRDGSHHSWKCKRTTIANLASEVITSSELCARSFLKPKTGALVMRQARIGRLKFGFQRRGAAKLYDAFLPD